MNKKSQLSIEFIVMMSVALAIVTIFLTVGNTLFFEKTEYQKFVAIRDIGYTIQSEIILAAKSEPGYSRVFVVPQEADRISFTISNTNSSFYLRYKQDVFTYFIPEIKGNISKGKNLITTNKTTIIIQNVT